MASLVVLRELADDDLLVFFEHQREPDACHMAAFTAKDPSDYAAFRAHWARIRGDDGITVQTILFEGRVVGHVAIFGPPGERQVTYWVGKEYWGKGIATEALTQFLRRIPTRPVYARAARDNLASLRVLEKCGFTVCGHGKFFANARGLEVEEAILKL